MKEITDLTQLRERLEASYRSLPLVVTPQDIVPGEGSLDATIVFIGEAPGYHESVQRRPFVGRSGQLFRETLKKVGLSEDKVYITNIVKARPPENRDPLPAEILAFKPFLDKEIELLRPELIVTLGRYSMAKFLPDVFISQVHGRLHKVTWNGMVQFVLPMYHPAAALRSTKVKESFIADFGKIEKVVAWIKDQKEIASLSQGVEKHLF
jgi:uracil-DNA glycosylase